MVILAFITLASFYSFDGIARMKETTDATAESYAYARVALGRITRELQMAYLTKHPTVSPEPRWVTQFRALPEEPMAVLHFATFSHQRLYRESPEADTTEISYLSAPDDSAPGLQMLLHREAPRIDGTPEEGGVTEVLARGVKQFTLRYFDPRKQEWVLEWDTNRIENLQQLPRAVEIGLVLVDREGYEHAYVTSVGLPLYPTKGDPSGVINTP